MKFILLVLTALVFFVILAALVLAQLPLAHYLNDKWLKMKNRSAKVGLLVCAMVGFGIYSFSVGGLYSWTPERNSSRREVGPSGHNLPRLKATNGGLRNGDRLKESEGGGGKRPNSRAVVRAPSLQASGDDYWTNLAKRYLHGISLKPDELVLRLNDMERRHFRLSDWEWQRLQVKLAEDPIVKGRIRASW